MRHLVPEFTMHDNMSAQIAADRSNELRSLVGTPGPAIAGELGSCGSLVVVGGDRGERCDQRSGHDHPAETDRKPVTGTVHGIDLVGTPDTVEDRMPLSVDKTSEKLMGIPEHERQAKICAEVSKALRPGTNSPRMSSSPRTAVIAPVGSFRMASALWGSRTTRMNHGCCEWPG